MYWMDFTEDSVFSLNFDVGKTWSQALARRIEFGQITSPLWASVSTYDKWV